MTLPSYPLSHATPNTSQSSQWQVNASTWLPPPHSAEPPEALFSGKGKSWSPMKPYCHLLSPPITVFCLLLCHLPPVGFPSNHPYRPFPCLLGKMKVKSAPHATLGGMTSLDCQAKGTGSSFNEGKQQLTSQRES